VVGQPGLRGPLSRFFILLRRGTARTIDEFVSRLKPTSIWDPLSGAGGRAVFLFRQLRQFWPFLPRHWFWNPFCFSQGVCSSYGFRVRSIFSFPRGPRTLLGIRQRPGGLSFQPVFLSRDAIGGWSRYVDGTLSLSFVILCIAVHPSLSKPQWFL